MANIEQLLTANRASYTALKDPKAINIKIDDYELVNYKFDKESNHGGLAYYNPKDKSVIVAHRGSATMTDWLKTNPQIALEVLGKPRETMADVAAKRFTNNILESLDRQGNELGLIIQTGHSLGGRLSQHSLIEVVENLGLESKALTFNSAPIKNPTGKIYEHVNLQLSGGNLLNTDIVSSFGKQLGENYKVVSNEISNPISAHLLSNFKHIQNEKPDFVKDELTKVLDHIKQGKNYFEYGAETVNENTKTFYSFSNRQTEGKDMNQANESKYSGIDESKLTLVRVQKGLEGVSAKNGEISIGKAEGESIRNTLHFTLNSVVQDHAYGKFSESKYAVIGNLKETSGKNNISGLSPSDTYFFQKDGKVNIPNATLVIPDNHKIDSGLLDNVNYITYKNDNDPKANYKNMENAIQKHFEKENIPFKEVDFHGFVGERVSNDEQKKLSQNLGSNGVLDANHAASIHGKMEIYQAQLKELNNDLESGEKLYKTSSGLEIPIKDRAIDIAQEINKDLGNSQKIEKEYYSEKLNSQLKNFDIDLNKETTMLKMPEPMQSSNFTMPPPLPIEMQNGSVPPPLPNGVGESIVHQSNQSTTERGNNMENEKPLYRIYGDDGNKADIRGFKETLESLDQAQNRFSEISINRVSKSGHEQPVAEYDSKSKTASVGQMANEAETKQLKEFAQDKKMNYENHYAPTVTVYHGQNSKMVAQLETNAENARFGENKEHVSSDSKKLAELQDKKQSYAQSIDSLKKADVKEFQELKEKGYRIEVHDLSNQTGKNAKEEKANIDELKRIADSYKQAEVPRAGKTYSGVVLAQGEDTTIQKTPTGKFIVHETENLTQMKVSDTHRNQSIKYVTDKQTDVKSIGYDELKKQQASQQEAKPVEQKRDNSAGFER